MQLWSLVTGLAFAQEAPPIVNGSYTSDYIQVGAIMAYDPNQGGASFCSGTLIEEFWVVTAAHCVEAVEEYAGYGFDIYFLLGDDLYSDTGVEFYDLVSAWEMHPDYAGSSTSLTADIGLLELQNGIPEVEPMALNQITPDDTWLGSNLDYVGWGVTSDNGQDSGWKRYTSIPYNTADSIFVYAYDPDTNLCSGDSGGAAMKENLDGTVLVGVNSFVFSVQGSDPCVGGASGATRIDVYHDWIRSYVPEPPEPEPEEEEEEEEEKTGLCSQVDPFSMGLWTLTVSVLGMRRRIQ